MIEEKLELLSWAKDWQLKFFVYVHPSMKIRDTVRRIIWLKEHRFFAYVMRHLDCWNSNYSDFFVDIASYTNQPNIFKKLDFNTFLEKRHTNMKRILSSKRLWNKNT